MRVIGLMSGTSYDAIDAAAADLRIEGDQLVLTPLGMLSQPVLRCAACGAGPFLASSNDNAGAGLPARHRDRAGLRRGREAGGRAALRWPCRPDRVARADRLPLGRRKAGSTGRCNSGSPLGSPRRPVPRSCPTCDPATSPPEARVRRWSASSTSSGCAAAPVRRSRSTSAASRTSPSYRDSRADRLRHRPGQRAGGRGGSRPHRRPVDLRRRRGDGRSRAGPPGAVRALAGGAVLRAAGAQEHRQGAVPPRLPRAGDVRAAR